MQDVEGAPVHSYQRKAAIADGAIADHSGDVVVRPIPDFDLDRTIFNTLIGRLPRYVMRTRVGKDVDWQKTARDRVSKAYEKASDATELPTIDPALLQFMKDDCDFDVEHADGSFLDHLYFCYEYTHHHLPSRSALVMLLHSILGTGTNTFAMTADKMSTLRTLVNDDEWLHISAFPSVLRLLYGLDLRRTLRANLDRLEQLKGVSFFRVIDNQQFSVDASVFWLQLNYQLIHLVDFIPVANWGTHANDTSFIVFRDLYDLLTQAGQREAQIRYVPETKPHRGEVQSLGAKVVSKIPVGLSERMAAKSIASFSRQIGHSLDFELHW